MTKTAAIISIVIAFGTVAVFFLFGNDSAPQEGASDVCPTGYALVGEGCITLKEACELQGDSYHFDSAKQQCLNNTL